MNPSNPDLAQAQGRPYSTRQSMSGRISRLFERRQGPSSHFSRSQRTSGACEVPIFMSQSSDHLHYHQDEEAVEVEPHHRESMEDDERHTVRGSSIYSQSPHFRAQNTMNEVEEDTHSRSSDVTHDLEAGHSTLSTTSEVDLLNQKRRKRRRIADSYRERIASKKKLGMAFGVTTLAAVITYTVLAVTGAAKGIMFHVLASAFILILMGVFLHSAIMLVILQRRRRARLARHHDWHGSRSGSSTVSSSRSRSDRSVDPFDDPISEKPIAVVVGGDEIVTTTPRGKNKKVIRPPPPVYGNYRESKKISPDMLFWHKQNPSPTTPTYEQALNEVHTAVGYQPPQYASPKRRPPIEAGQRVSDIHPLERGRLAGLLGNTMSSQRPRA